MATFAHPAPQAGARLATRDVVFTFAWVTWDVAQGRGMNFSEDRLLQRLLAEPRVGRLLVADTARSRAIRLARDVARRPGTAGGEPFPAAEGRQRLSPTRWRRDDPTSARAAQRWVASYERALRRGAVAMGMDRPAVVTFHPMVAAWGEFAWAEAVTYYAMDDWTGHPARAAWWPLLRAAHAEIGARGRRVVAVSPAILDLTPGADGVVVPNGIEPAEWLAPDPAPGWMRAAPAPRLVYTGSLDGRLDRAWLAAVSEAFPAASIHLVGRVLDAEHLAAIERLPNVTIHANVGRAEIAAICAGADVGLLPHVATPLTEAMSPLKVYEFLAAGLPVVATDLPPVRDLGPRTVLVPPGGDFVAGVRSALALGRTPEAERLAFIAENAWARRHDAILDVVLAPQR